LRSYFFFQAEDGIRDLTVTGVQTCALPILSDSRGRRLGGYVTYSGIRNIAVIGGRLEINWRRVSLRGVAMHEQNIQTGAALTPAQLRQLVARARAVGATVLRQHYPWNPQIEEMADEDGILLWSEIPVYHVHNPSLGL